MAVQEYRDPLLTKLIKMLEANGPKELVGHYVQGDVLAPNRSELPVVSIARQGTIVKSGGTMQDVHTSAIVMAVIYDWTQDLDQSFDLVRGSTALYRLIEERNDDYSAKENTLVYALRAFQKLHDNVFISIRDEGLRVDYGLGWEKRGSNIFSVEGILRFNIELTQEKPNWQP